MVASCRPDGKLRGEPLAAHAAVLTAAPELDRVQRLLEDRYVEHGNPGAHLLT